MLQVREHALFIGLFLILSAVYAEGVKPIVDETKTNEARRLEVMVILFAMEESAKNPGKPNMFLDEIRSTRGKDFVLPYTRDGADYLWWKIDSAFVEGYCYAGAAVEREYCPSFNRLKRLAGKR